jgi:MFS family permease
MLGYVYGHGKSTARFLSLTLFLFLTIIIIIIQGPALNSAQSLGVKVATPVGTFFGQLLFGWLADVVGRKRMCMYPVFSLYLHPLMSLQTVSSLSSSSLLPLLKLSPELPML